MAAPRSTAELATAIGLVPEWPMAPPGIDDQEVG